jgi:hypothetical protein
MGPNTTNGPPGTVTDIFAGLNIARLPVTSFAGVNLFSSDA